jgi:HK97 family phage prohead protease
MEHKTLVAETTVTDQELGEFEALVSAWDADREKDVIAVTAFDATVKAWRASGKSVPLLWEHSADVVGHIDPATMHPTEAGLVAAGEIDRETDRGAMAWRMIKSGVAGFSIGFMSESQPRPGGGRRLTRIDLLEVSITSTPMHPNTRALSWKTALDDDVPSEAEQRRRLARFMLPAEHEKHLSRWLGEFNEAISGTKATAPATKSKGPIRVARFPVE